MIYNYLIINFIITYFLMDLKTKPQQHTEDFKKITTPETSEGFDIFFYGNQHPTQKNIKINFQEIQKLTSDFFITEKQPELEQLPKKKEIPVLQFLQCNYQLRITLKSEEQSKQLIKQVSYYEEQSNIAKMILSKQNEKQYLELGVSYNLNISLILVGGFQRPLWEAILFFKEMNTKRLEMSLPLSNNTHFQIGFEVERYKQNQYSVKFYYFQAPIQKIEGIVDEKQRLINKSQEINKITKLKSLKGIYYELSKENMGSRIIQKLMNKADPQQLVLLTNQLEIHYSQMVIHRYANYVFQRLIQLSSFQKRNEILFKISNFFIEFLYSRAGTHALQKILQLINGEGFSLILNIISQEIIVLSMNQFATHFIQKFLKLYPQINLINTLLSQLSLLACDKHGIVVLKAILPICSGEPQYLRWQFYELVLKNFSLIVYNQYGHYIIQEMMKYYTVQQLTTLLNYLLYYFVDIANNQYSSSIIRRGLELCQDAWSHPIMTTLLQGNLKQIMETKSGSFVLHRILDLGKGSLKSHLINQMKIRVGEIHNYQGRNKWKKYFNLS